MTTDDPRGRVLLLYYSYTGQSRKALQTAGEVLAERGCEITEAAIEFTDPRFAETFGRFPMRRVWPDMLSVLPAQTRRATGQIRIPPQATDGRYDLVLIGSPTWWSTTSMPVRSFLTSDEARNLLADTPFAVVVVCRRYWRANFRTVRKLGERLGGKFVGGLHFTYPGGQLRSMLSLTSYLATGEYRDRYLRIPIPPTNVQPGHLARSREFAASLADTLFDTGAVR